MSNARPTILICTDRETCIIDNYVAWYKYNVTSINIAKVYQLLIQLNMWTFSEIENQ